MNKLLLLVGVSLVFLLVTLSVRDLESGDETRAAGIAYEMYQEQDWLVPRLNGTPFLEYPPMHCWVSVPFYYVFGSSDFVAKLPSVLACLGVIVLVYLLGQRMGMNESENLLAGFVLLSCGYFLQESHKCRVDMLLCFFVVLALYCFYGMVKSRGFACVCHGIFFGGALAGGILTKGMLGLALPGVYVLTYLILDDVRQRHFAFRLYLQCIACVVLAVLLASIWYLLLWRRSPEMFHEVFWVNNLGRLSGSQGDHVESVWYYFRKFPEMFWPWLPLVVYGVWRGLRALVSKGEQRLQLLTLWVLLPLLFLSVSAAKRIVYLLSLYPMAAILCGYVGVELWRTYVRCSIRPWILCGVLLLVIGAIDMGIGVRKNRKESLKPLFQECARLEAAGWHLKLMTPPERTRGAAFFYLHHYVPVLLDGEPQPGEVHICEGRKVPVGAKKYGSRHYLVMGLPK